jgi:peptidoglycan/xylan/chitin deacetylase (PgdA/CDA1 family)
MKLSHPLPVFLYHRINEAGGPGCTSLPVFRQHLDALADSGWRSLTLQEFEEIVTGRCSCPSRAFLITFDDGCDDLPTVARELALRGFSGVAFIVTGWLDGTTGRVDRQMVRKLSDEGIIEIASHGHDHIDFRANSDRNPGLARSDLSASLKEVGEMIGNPGRVHLAWPWGRSSETSRAMARELGFRLQFTVASRPVTETGTLADLWPRICVERMQAPAFSILTRLLRSRSACRLMALLNRMKRSAVR